MRDFGGSKVFITGGSAGIGKATALSLARAGARVAICARGQGSLDATLNELRAAGGGPHAAFSADVTRPAQIRAAAAAAIAELGGIDLLICNSGFSRSATAKDTSEDLMRQLMEVNFFGHVNTFAAFQDHFVERRQGDIVFVSSMFATFSVFGYGAYAASKCAITGFAESVRQEMMIHGVRVKLFMPPSTETPGFAAENEDKPALLHELETGSALNAVHKPEKVAEALLRWLPTNRFFGLATWDSKLQWFMARHFPELGLRLADSELRGAQKRLEKKQTVRPESA
jgi:NAD(P)-dependent dehydrogenase (short-subunit alcohol dehydrogenase family)